MVTSSSKRDVKVYITVTIAHPLNRREVMKMVCLVTHIDDEGQGAILGIFDSPKTYEEEVADLSDGYVQRYDVQ